MGESESVADAFFQHMGGESNDKGIVRLELHLEVGWDNNMRLLCIELPIGGQCIQVYSFLVVVCKVSHVFSKRLFEFKEGLDPSTRVKPVSRLLLAMPIDSHQFVVLVVLFVDWVDFINEELEVKVEAKRVQVRRV